MKNLRKKIIYYCPKYRQWKKKINIRDKKICQICGELGCLIHHKIPFSYMIQLYNIKTTKQANKCKLLWDINWGITLCRKCNTIIEVEL